MSPVFKSSSWGSAWKRCWVSVSGHCTSFVDPEGERPGVPGRVALGAKFMSCLDGTRSPSSPLQTCPAPLTPRKAVQVELYGRFYLKGTFSEGCQSWSVLACLILHSWLAFCLGCCHTKHCVKVRNRRTWHLLLFLRGMENLWIQQKVDSFSPLLCQEISTHKPDIFRGILHQNLPVRFNFTFLPDTVPNSFRKFLCCVNVTLLFKEPTY